MHDRLRLTLHVLRVENHQIAEGGQLADLAGNLAHLDGQRAGHPGGLASLHELLANGLGGRALLAALCGNDVQSMQVRALAKVVREEFK